LHRHGKIRNLYGTHCTARIANGLQSIWITILRIVVSAKPKISRPSPKTHRMKTTFFLALTAIFASCAMAQPGYTDYRQQEGFKVGTKWATAKDTSGTKRQALFLAIENKNEYAANFDIAVRFYYEGILREQSTIETQCLPSKKSMIGKLNGIYIIPQQFTEAQIKSSDFKFELEVENIQETEACVSATE